MTSNVLVLLDRATACAPALELLQRTAGLRCEAVTDIDAAVQRLGAARWELLLWAAPLRGTAFARLVQALSRRPQRPLLVLATADDPALLTAAMRYAHGCGVTVQGYVRGPLDGAAVSALLHGRGNAAVPGPAIPPVHGFGGSQPDAAPGRDEIAVAFLPQACATDPGDIEAVEVVPCWRHPLHGGPAGQRFLPPPADGEVALRRLSQVLGLAAAALAAWLPLGFHPSLSCPFPLALLDLDDCAGRVARVIQDHGLHARDLTFELDLSGGDHDLHAMAPALLDLRAEELEFAVSCGARHDGIGYATLLDVPVSELKLAPGLTDGVAFDPHVQQLVAGMVALAKRLDIRVVATGVAQPEDFAVLRDLGCDFMQGPVVGGLWPAASLARPCVPWHADVQHA
ncbi:hypothetical protein Tamer19_10410 [Cupriavidus sp. TA19]|uniref:EAL domain-containing protein n=1 Tax=unclassified Cupriavidus TaxID=2640874 RepID=UPI000E2EE2EF|nr:MULTISPECIES: EAL domain-containing protein [unclassified Cupriavidus]BDB27591.1 EAL domain-containing protein [Cupriavidus sp. P-10]GLC91633.1 hypothetical protein Tamer19_10410 [Cupriavidus sp. TA19]